MIIGTNNKIISNFLKENDYLSKSNLSADKILSKIPNELKHYFFRGLVDGDGCFYINKKNSTHQFSLSSSYEQDWSYVKKIFDDIGISYKTSQRKQVQYEKINKSSIIRITNKKDIEKLGYYLYNNYPNDNIGLNRKYEKYKSIISDDYQ